MVRAPCRVTVVGDLRDGDLVFWDANADTKFDADDDDVSLEIDGNTASADFDLEDVVPGSYVLYYAPNGEDPMRSGTISTTAAATFDRDTNPESWRGPRSLVIEL